MKGHILFVRTNTLLGKIIRKVTGGYFNHVGIFVSDNAIVEASYTGIKVTHIKQFEKLQEKGKIEYRIGKVEVATNCQIDKAVEYALDTIGTKYDFLQLVSLFLFAVLKINRTVEPIDCKNMFICSELVAKSFNHAGINFNDKIELDVITPADIESSNIVAI